MYNKRLYREIFPDYDFIPAAKVYNNAVQSIPNGTGQVLTFNNERFDNNTFHDNSRLTCTTGLYDYWGIEFEREELGY